MPPTKLSTSASRKLTAVAMFLLVGIIVGCMSLSFGGRTVTYAPTDSPSSPSVPSDGAPYAQEGTVSVKASGTRTIYYPLPYASSPNLELRDGDGEESEHFEIVEQRADRFTVRNTDWAWARSCKWVAKGARPAPPPPTPVPTLPPPTPEPTLPPQPRPVEGSALPSPK